MYLGILYLAIIAWNLVLATLLMLNKYYRIMGIRGRTK